jgi:hypothetical protein
VVHSCKGVDDGQKGSRGEGLVKEQYSGKCCTYLYHCTRVPPSNEHFVWVINKPCVRETRYVHAFNFLDLSSW